MARAFLIGGETGDLSELASTGTAVIESSVINSAGGTKGGAYSYKVATSGSPAACIAALGLNLSTIYVKLYWRVSSIATPGSSTGYHVLAFYNGGSVLGEVWIEQSAAGAFTIFCTNSSGSFITNAPLTVAANTWYQIEARFTVGAGTGSLDVYFNDPARASPVISVTNQQFGSSNVERFLFGNQYGGAQSRDYFFDDIEADSAGYCGGSYVIARSPTSGTPFKDFWSKSTGNDAYALWNDTPFDSADFVRSWLAWADQSALIASFGSTQSGHGAGTIATSDTINGANVALVGKTASIAANSVSQVGNILAVAQANGANVTLTFSSAPQTGDLVIVWGGHTSTRPTPIGPSTAGYDLIGTIQTQTTNTFGVWWKTMGGTPDTNVVCQGTGNNADAAAYGCIVLRGVENFDENNFKITFANGSSTNPNPGSVTPDTTGDIVVICAGTVANDSAWTNPANYSAAVAAGATDTNAYSVGGAVRLAGLTGGSPEDPAAFTNVGTGVWIAASIAVKACVESGADFYVYRRVGGADDYTFRSLTTSDVLYRSEIFVPSLTDLNSMEAGGSHGHTFQIQTVEDVWVMVSHTPSGVPDLPKGQFVLGQAVHRASRW